MMMQLLMPYALNKHVFIHLENKVYRPRHLYCTTVFYCNAVFVIIHFIFIKKLQLLEMWILHLAIL